MAKRPSCLEGKWRTLITVLLFLLLFQLAYYVLQSGPMYVNIQNSLLTANPILKLIKTRDSLIQTNIQGYDKNTNDTEYPIPSFNIGDGSFIRTGLQGYHNISNYTVIGDNRYFLYSAFGEQSLQNKRWMFVVFNGWEVIAKAKGSPYICCFKYSDGSIQTSTYYAERPFWFKAPLMAKQILCDIKDNHRPKFATLVLKSSKCHKNTSFYKPVYKEMVKEPKFAINAQIAYGRKNASEIIEFMEYHLHYGAHPIIIYQYFDLNKEARKVLQYYVARGDLEVIDYPKIPLQGIFKRSLGEVSKLMTNDQQVSNFDAEQRLRPYKYFTIMDTDEFIVPGRDIPNFLQLLENLFGKNKKIAWFTMFTEIHFFDWAPTNKNSSLMISRYGYHTESTLLAPKSLYMPQRSLPGTLWIHGTKPLPGYKMEEIQRDDVFLKHFRLCKYMWMARMKNPKPKCEDNFKKLRGHFMERIADVIKDKVLHVKKIVGIL